MKKTMASALKKVKLQHSDATLNDAKDCYIMLLLDKKLDPIHEQGKLKESRNKRHVSKIYFT